MNDLSDYEIIHTFKIMHVGWELDNEGWIAKNKKGELVFLITSHGDLRDQGKDITELHEKLVEAKEYLAGLKLAINLMTQMKGK